MCVYYLDTGSAGTCHHGIKGNAKKVRPENTNVTPLAWQCGQTLKRKMDDETSFGETKMS